MRRYKYVVILLLLLMSCIFAKVFWHQILHGLRWVLDIPNLNFWSGGFALIISIVAKLAENKITFKNHIAFDQWKQGMEEIISFFSGGPITLICSISLAKGLFLQWISVEKYFLNFQDWELFFIFSITLYLLYISIIEVKKDLKKIYPTKKGFTPKPIEKPNVD